MEVKKIDRKFIMALQTTIRSAKTEVEYLKTSITKIGEKIGEEIINEDMMNETIIETPMGEMFEGYQINQSVNIIYSTKDDFSYFAAGIKMVIPNCLQGYLDFGGVRGQKALTQPIRSASHPNVPKHTVIENVIIAKSVLATGCTAISLAKNINEKYSPKNLIIATAFYSDLGILELKQEIPNIKSIYVVGEADILDPDGMLVPGLGNIDKRLSS